MSASQQAVEASMLVDEFISEASKFELNLDMHVRSEIKRKVAAGEITHTLFDDAERHAVNLLRFSIFPLFKSSSALKDYLKKSNAKDILDVKQLRSAASSKSLPRGHSEEVAMSLELEHT